MMDMTEALRPSELFALRWRSFDGANTLSITETVYKGKLRAFGKTEGNGMPLIQIAITLIIVGVLMWLMNRFIPMQSTI